LNSIETVKGQPDDIGSFVGHRAQPGIDPNYPSDEAPQRTVNSFTTPQPTKSTKFTDPLFGFDSFKIHADNQQASTGQGQPAADTIGTSKGEKSLMTNTSGTEVGEPPSTNQNANANQQAVKDGPGDHLSPISANVAVDVPSSTRKTRQSARKQITGAKRDGSTELKAAQPKRGKNSSPTATPSTNPTTNPAAIPTVNPPVTRGRGRPRKHPI
jgi:hypothetical protein